MQLKLTQLNGELILTRNGGSIKRKHWERNKAFKKYLEWGTFSHVIKITGTLRKRSIIMVTVVQPIQVTMHCLEHAWIGDYGNSWKNKLGEHSSFLPEHNFSVVWSHSETYEDVE